MGPDHDVPATLNQEVAFLTERNTVAGQHHATTILQMDVDGLVADVIAGDGPHADLVHVRRPDEAQVGAAGADFGLNGVADDAPLADAPCRGVDPDVGRLLGGGIEVVFDVVAGDVQVADFAGNDIDAAAPAIADVAAVNNRLVQIDAVERDEDAATVGEEAHGE